MAKWRTIKTHKILDHPRLSVYEDDILLPNGFASTYIHFGAAKDSVSIIAINNHAQILVQKEYNYPPNKWLYQFPGGGIEFNETPIKAALRELSEESDITGDLRPIGWYYTDNRRRRDKQYVFIAQNIRSHKGRKDLEEEIENYWLTERKIELLIKNNNIVIESMLAAWSLYLNYSRLTNS